MYVYISNYPGNFLIKLNIPVTVPIKYLLLTYPIWTSQEITSSWLKPMFQLQHGRPFNKALAPRSVEKNHGLSAQKLTIMWDRTKRLLYIADFFFFAFYLTQIQDESLSLYIYTCSHTYVYIYICILYIFIHTYTHRDTHLSKHSMCFHKGYWPWIRRTLAHRVLEEHPQ